MCTDTSNCVTLTPETGCVIPCTNPTASIFAIQPSCTNDMANSDGYLQLSAFTDADRINWINESDYTNGDTDYANATPIGALPFQFNTGLSNTNAGDFTIRVFNGASDCFTDVVVTLNEQTCDVGCECNEFIYLNDTGIDAVHKFRVEADNSLTEIGAPWLKDTILAPHGLLTDNNLSLIHI